MDGFEAPRAFDGPIERCTLVSQHPGSGVAAPLCEIVLYRDRLERWSCSHREPWLVMVTGDAEIWSCWLVSHAGGVRVAQTVGVARCGHHVDSTVRVVVLCPRSYVS